MVVGHNPGMDLCLLSLYKDADKLATEKLMTTAATAVLEVQEGNLKQGRLLAFKRLKDID